MTNNNYFLFTDESCVNNPEKQYSAICAMSGGVQFFKSHQKQIESILNKPGEYKFQKLNKDTKNDILQLCHDFIFPAIASGNLRIDALVWNNRIYPKKQEIMHYHLLLAVLRRYSPDINWLYYPDQDRGKNYLEITNIVNTAVNSGNIYMQSLIKLATEYNIQYGGELDSKNSRLIQITDIFAGLAAFSYNNYGDYTDWIKNTTGAPSFDFAQSDIENNNTAINHHPKFQLLDAINTECKKHNSKHSIDTKHGLHSFDPSYGMNFWLWGNDRSALKRAQQ